MGLESAELLTLYEIMNLSIPRSYPEFFQKIVEKASRVLG